MIALMRHSKTPSFTARLVACAIVLMGMGPLVEAQNQTGAPSRPAGAGAVPRTPWGDPDLQGTYTNKYEQSTPLERPKGFEGRRVEDIKGEELTRVLQERQRISDERAPFLAGDPTGEIRGNQAFSDRGEITKGSRAWMIVDPPDGQIPALTAEAQKAAADRARARGGRRASSFTNGPFDTFEDFSLYDRCITRGYPGSMLPAIYGNSYQIVQAPGIVAIRYEMIHETRVIPIDGPGHAGKALRLDMGDARGRWEGDTLVVETTNLHERSAYRNGNTESMRLVERFTRTGPNTVEWRVTVDDAKTWTRQWSFALPPRQLARVGQLSRKQEQPAVEHDRGQ